MLTSHFADLERREERNGYTIHRVPTLRRRLDRCSVPEMAAFELGAIVPALRLARAFRPDLMHVYFGMPTGPVALLVNRLTGIPYLLSLRGGDVPGFMGDELALLHRLTLPLTRAVWSAADRIVVNGEGLRDLAARTLRGRRIDVIPNGVDIQTFCPGEASARRNGEVRLLFAGRMARQKGLPDLLQALAPLEPPVLERVSVELVGAGPEEGRVRSLAIQLGLAERVTFTGWVSRSAIVAHYQRAHIFVLPSYDEGMPNVVLEAMACGLPIVATNIRGNREVVSDGENGILVPPGDVEALRGALRDLIMDEGLRLRMGEASRAQALHHDWSRAAERYLAISREIVEAAEHHPAARGG